MQFFKKWENLVEFWAAMLQTWKEKLLWRRPVECMNLCGEKNRREAGLRRKRKIKKRKCKTKRKDKWCIVLLRVPYYNFDKIDKNYLFSDNWKWKYLGIEDWPGKTFFQIPKKIFPENIPHLLFLQLSSDKHSWTLRTFYLRNARPSNPSPYLE